MPAAACSGRLRMVVTAQDIVGELLAAWRMTILITALAAAGIDWLLV